MAVQLPAIVKLGDSLDSSDVKDSGPPNRSLLWEEDAPAETPLRRVRQVASPKSGRPGTGRELPGMPLDFDDVDEDDEPRGKRSRSSRFDEPVEPWWKPTTKSGRIILAVGALVVLGGLTTAAMMFKHSLERDGRFRIAGSDDIHANGLTEVRRIDLLPVFGEDIGRNIFFVPLAERRKQLEQISWVKQATVMRLLPDQLQVNIVERQPVAFTRQGSQVGLVDADGVLLSMPAAAMARHHYSFPVLTGINRNDTPDARRTRVAVYMRMMSELDAGGQKNSEQLSEIDLTDPEDARVTMPEAGADILAHFGEDHFLERYQRYKAHIAEWRQQYPNLSAVDLRYDQQVVLQMASGKELAPGASADLPKAKPAAGDPAPKAAPAKAASIKAVPAKPKTQPAKTSSKSATASAAAKKKQQELKKQQNLKKQQAKKSAAKKAASNETRRKPVTKPAQVTSRSHTASSHAQGG